MRFSYASGQGSLGPRLRSGFWKLLPSLCFRASAGRRTWWGFPLGGRGGRADSGGRRSPQRRSRTGAAKADTGTKVLCQTGEQLAALRNADGIVLRGEGIFTQEVPHCWAMLSLPAMWGLFIISVTTAIKSDWFNFLISFMVSVKYRYITLRARKSNLWRGESVAETHHHNHKFRFLDYILTTILWMIMKINHYKILKY